MVHGLTTIAMQENEMMTDMQYGSVCSGIGSDHIAWSNLGWDCRFFAEIDPFASSVLQQRFPHINNIGDFTKYDGQEGFDLLVGGTPCQSFSIAGSRLGLDDPRGNLTLEYAKLAKRYKPRWIIWENVPGVLSSGGRRDFGIFCAALANIGYGFAWRVLDAQNFGVPQRRRRVFLVGYIGDWRPPAAVLFESKSSARNIESSQEAQPKTSSKITGGAATECFGNPRQSILKVATTRTAKHRDDFESDIFVIHARQDPITAINIALPVEAQGPSAVFAWDLNQITSSNNRSNLKAGNPCHTLHTIAPAVSRGAIIRRLTPIECERLQGLPDNHTQIAWLGKPPEECPKGCRYKAIGNGFAVPVIRWVGERIALLDPYLRDTTRRDEQMAKAKVTAKKAKPKSKAAAKKSTKISENKKKTTKEKPAKAKAAEKPAPTKKPETPQEQYTVNGLLKEGAKILELDPKQVGFLKTGIKRLMLGDIDGLAESIATEGQIQPIVVRAVKKKVGDKRVTGYVLIAGSRRRAACEQLGIKVKAVIATPQNATHFLDLQLAENIHRKGFDLLEIAEALVQRKAQYAKDTKTNRGDAGRGRPKAEDAPERFAVMMAKKLGVSEATISRLMQADALPDAAKLKVEEAETSEERNQIVRDELRAQKKQAKLTKLQAEADEKAAARAAEYEEDDDDQGEELSEELEREEEEEGASADGDEGSEDGDEPAEEEEPPTLPKKSKKVPPRVAMYQGTYQEVMPEILTKGAIDLILTDPPYGLERNTIGHDDRTDIAEEVDWDDLDVGWVLDMVDYLADDGQILAFCPLEEIGNYKEVFEEADMRV